MKSIWITLALVVCLPVRLEPQENSSPAGQEKNRITLQHVISGRSPIRLAPADSGFQWMEDGRAILYRPVDRSKSRQCRYWVQGIEPGSDRAFVEREKVVAAAAKLSDPPEAFTGRRFTFTPDLRRLVFRHGDHYFFYDRKTGTMTRSARVERLPRGRPGRPRATPDGEAPRRFVSLAPDVRHVAWVTAGNLWATDLTTGEENRFTDDGDGNVLNGVHSWVYYEELYHRNYQAYWWSPDGKRIAFLRQDDSPVPRIPLVDEVPTAFLEIPQRYPKAGMPNPEVKLGVVDVATGGVTWMNTGAEREDLLGHVAWTPDGERVVVQVLSRIQNRLRLVLCDPASGQGTCLVDEKNESWIPIKVDYRFLKNGDLVWPSERDGYRHLYLYGPDHTLRRRLTSGAWTVLRLLGVDEKRGEAYFLANQGSSLERHLFRVGLDGHGLTQLTREPGTHSITLSPTCDHFIDTYTAFNVPGRVWLKDRSGKTVRRLAESSVRGLDRYHVCEPEPFTYRTTDGLQLPGFLLKPPDFRKGRRYPLIVSIYGGPGSQGVANQWQSSGNVNEQALAQRGFVVVRLDHRGANHLGHAGNARMYGNLGKWEVSDYADGVRHLVQEGLVDPERVGIWGWSYGGYVTCMALLTAPDVFRVGVAVAPVTDWRNYDSIYTERYMGLPEVNRAGYRDASAQTHARRLEGKLLIMHGLLDDNVHFQNTVQLVSALVQAGKTFDIMIYPQSNHGIYHHNARPHLFRKMFDYFETHLLKNERKP